MSTQVSFENLAFLETVKGRADFPVDCDRGWSTNNSTLERYFAPVQFTGRSEGALEIIKAQIGKDPDNVGIDIAGGTDGVALRGLIAEGIVGRGIVTNHDEGDRSEEAKNDPLVDFVDGDLLSRETWEEIINRQRETAPDGAAVIMHSPVSGLQWLPGSFYQGGVHQLLNMLRSGGLLFTQIPGILRDNKAEQSLASVCATVRDRPDVAEVISSKRSPMERGTTAIVIKN